MEPTIDRVMLDLVDWLAKRERTWEEMLSAWRSECSKTPIWEDAIRRGLVIAETIGGRSIVRPTLLGLLENELRKEMTRQMEISRTDLADHHWNCSGQTEVLPEITQILPFNDEPFA